MRAAVQRVSSATVRVDGKAIGMIGHGLLVYVGVAATDGPEDAAYVADKILHVRIFPDDEHKMNLDVQQVCGAVLLVSAFTLQADSRKGRRPSFDAAASGQAAEDLYERVGTYVRERGVEVQTGAFGAVMAVESVNDGPICVLLDSGRAF